uniref:Translation machinery-associated protein 16 n=1 Tax=Timema bartmani TaxID=61472 RepID=A0A7R9I3S7_9NEOP|nr:unnamed protein product [Timema bartmani]
MDMPNPNTARKELLKLKKVIHPKSRKTQALAKQVNKVSAREKTKLVHHMKQNLLGEKLIWFRDNLEPGAAAYTPQLVVQLIDKYLKRFSDELEQIKLKHSVGNRGKSRQHASREDIIRLTVLRDEEEFATCGLGIVQLPSRFTQVFFLTLRLTTQVPDLLNPKQLQLLRSWSGELRYIQNLRLVRLHRRGLKELASKQPQGLATVEAEVPGEQEEGTGIRRTEEAEQRPVCPREGSKRSELS